MNPPTPIPEGERTYRRRDQDGTELTLIVPVDHQRTVKISAELLHMLLVELGWTHDPDAPAYPPIAHIQVGSPRYLPLGYPWPGVAE